MFSIHYILTVSYTHLDVYKRQGKARMCCNNVGLPSVWNENVKCSEKYCDESNYEREKELEYFNLNRSYKELIEKMNIQRMMINNVDLLCTVVNLSLIHI